MPGKTSVNIDQTLIDGFFHDPVGGPYREMVRRSNNVQSAIRKEAPKRTGLLAASVRKGVPTFGRTRNTIVVQIDIGGRSTPYLGYILNGTEPHIIRPKGSHTRTVTKSRVSRGGRQAIAVVHVKSRLRVKTHALRFMAGGGVVFASVVHHPGTSPNDFINRGLALGFAQ
jgi:hypothetical protein